MKTKKILKEIGLYASALLVGGIGVYLISQIPSKELPSLPKKTIGEYTITLNKHVPRYNHLLIQDKEKNSILYALDYNKNTLIDEIYLKTYDPDSTIQRLSSVKELSKIEKELLEK